MKTRPFFRIACFLLCACLLLSGCGEEIQTPEEETVSIWLVEGELLSAELAALAAPYCKSVFTAENAAQALDAALAALKPGEALVVAGSLYLASELRPQLMRFKGKSEN